MRLDTGWGNSSWGGVSYWGPSSGPPCRGVLYSAGGGRSVSSTWLRLREAGHPCLAPLEVLPATHTPASWPISRYWQWNKPFFWSVSCHMGTDLKISKLYWWYHWLWTHSAFMGVSLVLMTLSSVFNLEKEIPSKRWNCDRPTTRAYRLKNAIC